MSRNTAKGTHCTVCGDALSSSGLAVSPRLYCSEKCRNAARRSRYVPRPRKSIDTLSRRLWSRVKKKSSGCWEWQGYRMPFGYGQIGLERGKVLTTHRAAWILTHGDPGSLHVLHRCDNPPCINPDHLFLGTNGDNTADMVAKGRTAAGFRLQQTRLSPDDVRAIRRNYRRPKKGQRGNSGELAAYYGVTANYITAVAARRERADVA